MSRLNRMLLGAVAALATAACVPAPGPSAPESGELQIGADYRASAVTRWVCDTEGSVVLATTPAGYRLHLENRDWVMTGKDAGDLVAFTHSVTGGSVDVGLTGIGWSSITLPGVTTVYLASKTPGGDLVIKRALTSGVVDEKCALAGG